MLPFKRLAAEQMPALLLAGLIAEFFYKFHSFTLECIGFLITWFVLDAAVQWMRSRTRGPSSQQL
jgi:hypothetical protein